MVIQVIDNLFHHVALIGGFKFIARSLGGRGGSLLPVEKQDHLGHIGLQHEIAPRLTSLALCLDLGAETGKENKGFFCGMQKKLPAGKADLVAFHAAQPDIRKRNIEFHQRGKRRTVGALVHRPGVE